MIDLYRDKLLHMNIKMTKPGKFKANMVKRTVKSFLNGESNISWTMGVIIHSRLDKETLKDIFDELKHYGDGSLFQDLMERCKERQLF